MPKISEDLWRLNRQNIIDAAFDLFAADGYAKVSVNDIIRTAGVSKGGFYTYFQSKQEIFLAIAERSDAEKATLASRLDPALCPAERIGQYLIARLENFYSEDNRKWAKFAFEFWSTADMTPDLLALNHQRFESFIKDLSAVIQEGIDAGDFVKTLEVDAVVYLILAIIDGCASMTAVMHKPMDQKTIETAADIVTSYLKGRLTT